MKLESDCLRSENQLVGSPHNARLMYDSYTLLLYTKSACLPTQYLHGWASVLSTRHSILVYTYYQVSQVGKYRDSVVEDVYP